MSLETGDKRLAKASVVFGGGGGGVVVVVVV